MENKASVRGKIAAGTAFLFLLYHLTLLAAPQKKTLEKIRTASLHAGVDTTAGNTPARFKKSN
jgi:hypothetical protein